MPTLHRVTFERNTVTGQWRASCSCFWVSGRADRESVMKAAAIHDLEWKPDEQTDREYSEQRTALRDALRPQKTENAA